MSEQKIQAFNWCGHTAHVVQHRTEPGRYAIICWRCHDRWCVPCGLDRSRRLSGRVLELLGGKPGRFITLTYRSTSADLLKKLITDVWQAFRRLRESPLWRACVTGGVAFMETKWVPDTARWHVHLHLVVQGRFLAQDQLSKAWRNVTGHSYIVDIRYIRSAYDVAKYVTKYVTKGVSGEAVRDPDRLREAILALKGRRLATTFGEWRGQPLLKRPEGQEDQWEWIGKLNDLLQDAKKGDTEAQVVLKALYAGQSDGLYELHWDSPYAGWIPPPEGDGDHVRGPVW